ncbi:PTS mannose/fructose/sorbose/N-acetylgalactosamine transporter subunit IIC [Olsenella intestinalis]|uniref:PTS mannose/fructose/sorbose/N-acetylgalactosamine transporter subunit IIC n=1 Tax=Olsenella intestinalis TaxID=2930083 RepID=UPI00200E6902|nr:PTS sugar transporter subunit IIC [Olsenella intestinalis]
MEYSIVQVVLVFLVTFIAAIDQFNFLESLYQPIVMGLVIGLILGDVRTGLVVGGTYQLMTIGNMPIGGAQPPNAVVGGIMACVLAISLKLDANIAVATAIPFSLLGQYGVTLIFTLMSPLMGKADQYAAEANPKGIERINYFAMALLGLVFGAVVTLFFIGGATMGQAVVDAIPTWLSDGLSAAGGMMRFVGFAILLKFMMNRDMWGFYFLGFGLALVVSTNEVLATPALLILALIGFGIAYWDFQQQTELKGAAQEFDGGEEDGI